MWKFLDFGQWSGYKKNEWAMLQHLIGNGSGSFKRGTLSSKR